VRGGLLHDFSVINSMGMANRYYHNEILTTNNSLLEKVKHQMNRWTQGDSYLLDNFLYVSISAK